MLDEITKGMRENLTDVTSTITEESQSNNLKGEKLKANDNMLDKEEQQLEELLQTF